MSINDSESDFSEIHRKACEKGEESYIDPTSGYLVFTEVFHKRRGHCCKSSCRHCPWNYKKNRKNLPSPK